MSFQRSIFLSVLVVVAIPVGAGLAAGTWALREFVTASGTAGPWDQVGESGVELLDAVEPFAETDPALGALAERHRENLSESALLSRRYAFVGERLLQVLPVIVLLTAIAIGLLALLMARRLSRSLSRPVTELVGWTQLIARSEPLPHVTDERWHDVQELSQLKDALRSMARELDVAREREVEAARLRSWTDMARGVAHEIKNPLTPMRIAASSVARLEETLASEAGQVLLEEIDRLDEMARSFAQFGRLPEGPPSEVDLEELLDGLVRQYADSPSKISLEVTDSLPMVRGHYDALLRVFRNLLVNAEEAGPPVRIRISQVEAGVEVVVEDSGPGVPEENMESIWSPDFTTKRKGTGLGLPMVRRTVEAHGGSVRAKNLPQSGAAFHVILPFRGE